MNKFLLKTILFSFLLSLGLFIYLLNNHILNSIYESKQKTSDIDINLQKIQKEQSLEKWIYDNYETEQNVERKTYSNSEEDMISFFDSLPKKINPQLVTYIYKDIDAIMSISFNFDLHNETDIYDLINCKYSGGITYFKKIKIENGVVSGEINIYQPLIFENGGKK